MENKNIIIILIAIIIVLAAGTCALYFQSNAKETSCLQITSTPTISEGEWISLRLTDLNKTGLTNEDINIVITDQQNTVVTNSTVKTDTNGIAKLDLALEVGNYTVNVTFNGNENFTANTTSQNLTVRENIKETDVGSPTYTGSSSGSEAKTYQRYSPQYGAYINEYYDSNGDVYVEASDGSSERYDASTGKITHTFADGHSVTSSMGD